MDKTSTTRSARRRSEPAPPQPQTAYLARVSGGKTAYGSAVLRLLTALLSSGLAALAFVAAAQTFPVNPVAALVCFVGAIGCAWFALANFGRWRRGDASARASTPDARDQGSKPARTPHKKRPGRR